MPVSRVLVGLALLGGVAIAGALFSRGPDTASATGQPAQVVGGTWHTCMLTPAGTVKCWGDNELGQLGNNSTSPSSTPVDVCSTNSCASPLNGVVQIAAGANHTCAVMDGGGLKCWGNNSLGQIGEGQFCDPCTTPQDVCGNETCTADLTGVAEVTAGSSFTCARMTDRTVQCWGYDSGGQLGDGELGDEARGVPRPVCANTMCAEPLDDIVSIDAGSSHVCALQQRPVTIEPPVVAGGITPPFLSFNAVMCWGYNRDHQLGTDASEECGHRNRDTCSSVPLDVCADASCNDVLVASAVSAGSNHTCALMTDAAVTCWGDNVLGQTGTNSGANTVDYPTSVCGNDACGVLLADVSELDVASSHTCVITSQTGTDGMKCWGANYAGQLGIGAKHEIGDPDTAAPVPVCRPEGCSSPLVNVEAMGLGSGTSCAVAPGPSPIVGPVAGLVQFQPDALMCWGDNEYGQVGDGTMTQRTLPVVVAGVKPTPTPTDTPAPGEPTDSPTPTPEAGTTPTPTSPPSMVLLGDVDCSGSVTAIDAALELQFIAGLLAELPCPEGADANQDGNVNSIDAALILQASAGLVSLPL